MKLRIAIVIALVLLSITTKSSAMQYPDPESDQSTETFDVQLVVGENVAELEYEACNLTDFGVPARLTVQSSDDEFTFKYELPRGLKGTATIAGADQNVCVFEFEIELPESGAYVFTVLDQELSSRSWIMMQRLDVVQLLLMPTEEQSVSPDQSSGSTGTSSSDEDKNIVDPVAYLPESSNAHQAGYVNRSGSSTQLLVLVVTAYVFDDPFEAEDVFQGVCDDVAAYFMELNGSAYWREVDRFGDETCAVDGGRSTSIGVVVRSGPWILVFSGGGLSDNAGVLVEDAVGSFVESGEVRLGDTKWIPDGEWSVQTGPYNITNTAHTPKEERP